MTHHLKQAIPDRVVKAIRSTFPFGNRKIAGETRFVEDLSLDRVAIMELAMVIETEFDTEFPRKVIARFRTVSDVVGYLSEHLSSEDAPTFFCRSSC